MKIRKFKALYGSVEHDDCEIICNKEELEILKYALEMHGVNVLVSSSCISDDEYHVYVRNEYLTALHIGFSADHADEVFNRNKRR